MKTLSSQPAAVLVIDDDPGIRNVIADIVALEGIKAFKATHGQQGIDLYEEHQAEIGLVLLDLQLPDIFGLEVMKRLQQLNPNVSILIITGKYDPQSHLEPGMEYLSKPFTMMELLNIVKERLGKIVFPI